MNMFQRLVLTLALVLMAATGSVADDGALFFVNDPQNLVYADLNKIATVCENYYRSLGILNSDDMAKFWEVVRSHGAPKAGAGKSLVGLVIQDTSHPANGTGVPRGVLVLHGAFDKAKVLELMRKNYVEHVEKAGHEPFFNEFEKKGIKVHKFGLPAKNRELTMMSFSGYHLFHSAQVGDIGLLNETVTAITTRRPATEEGTMQAAVRYRLAPTAEDKTHLNNLVDKKYDKWKAENLATKRRGLKRFIMGRVSRGKVDFVHAAINELGDADLEIDRLRDASINTKRMRLVASFDNEQKARDVKKKLLSHLGDVIKSSPNPADKFGMANNVRITCEGSAVTVESQLTSAEEQLHTFAILSSYIARSMLRDRD